MSDQRRSEASERLRRWNRAFNPVVVVAAILPLGPLADDDPTSGPGVVIALGSWLVFAVDFGVRTYLDRGFPGTWKGKLYLGIVVVTFPVYILVPGLEEVDLLSISRLGWIAVLALSGVESVRDTRLLIRRVGSAGLYAATATLLAAFLVRRVEQAEDGFETFGDSLWWAVATITTVGYGDRVPVTATGRVVAAMLMVVGLAFLGVIAASLAAYFGVDDAEQDEGADAASAQRPELLLDEIRALRAEVARLVDRVEAGPPLAADSPASASTGDGTNDPPEPPNADVGAR